MKLDDRDKMELAGSFLIITVVFFAYSFTPLSTLVHEVGHQFSCLTMDGEYQTTGVIEDTHTTRCRMDEGFTGSQTLLLAISGIGIEVILGGILMLLGVFLASTLGVIGSLFLFNTTLKLFFGAYGHDLEMASEIVPFFGGLQLTWVQWALVVLSMSFALVFVERMIREKKKRDFPFDFDIEG